MTTPLQVWQAWRDGDEITLLDVREEAEFARGHPLFAASMSVGQIELEIYDRIPRHDVAIVCYDDGDGRAPIAVERIAALGYSDVTLLDGGLSGWRGAGLEIFIDVNSPSKAFGELVDARCRPPSVSPGDLERRIAAGEKLLIVDARRFDEYETMSIPTARNVPGGELVRRIDALVSDTRTPVIVNCAGRTRSIVGAQSLRNAELENPVAALRNGTIGWTLAGLDLDHGASERFDPRPAPTRARVAAAQAHARRAGVEAINLKSLATLGSIGRTVYRFDVREIDEYRAGHLEGFLHAPGGQLVQETDHFAPVRGALVVCSDDDGVRASMTGSWLAQMGWSVQTVTFDASDGQLVTAVDDRTTPPLPEVTTTTGPELANRLGEPGVVVADVSRSTSYRRGHIPGSHFVLRHELADRIAQIGPVRHVVVTSEDGILAFFAAADLAATPFSVAALTGGTTAWRAEGGSMEVGEERWLSPPLDRYRRPYEGTDVDHRAMDAYLEWEYGLVAQLERDGAHRFEVVCDAL